MKKLLFLPIIVFMLGILALSPFAASAHATAVTPQTDTTHCASLGTLIETDKIYDESTLLGYLNVYNNSSNGYNCAETTSASATYGVLKGMEVHIETCEETTQGNACTPISGSKPYYDFDDGNYSYYVGPAGVYGAGHCILASGYIEWGGVWYGVITSPYASHCG